jgi:hypothetical protein
MLKFFKTRVLNEQHVSNRGNCGWLISVALMRSPGVVQHSLVLRMSVGNASKWKAADTSTG